MRHVFTLKDLQFRFGDSLIDEFALIAESRHYKALFEIQKRESIGLCSAIRQMLNNPSFSKMMLDHFNEHDNHSRIVLKEIRNSYLFNDIKLPDRECDFAVEQGLDCGFFWVDERIALFDENSKELAMCKLIVDDKSNTLFYSLDTFDRLAAFNDYLDNSFESKVAVAYRDFLAERELLTNRGQDVSGASGAAQ